MENMPIECYVKLKSDRLMNTVYDSANMAQVTVDSGFLRNEMPSCDIKFYRSDVQVFADGLRELADFFSGTAKTDLPVPKKVHMNDPWTVIEWEDGTKSKIKCHDDDTYNPLYGVLRNVIRKVGHNNVTVDAWEPVIDVLSEFIGNPDEAAFLGAVLDVLCDVMTLDGAMERLADYDVRNDEQVSDVDRERFANALVDLSNGINPSQMSQDEIRQMVRNLQLDGEL